MRHLKTFLADERGQDLVEYALMAGFVATAAGFLMSPVVVGINKVVVSLLRILGGEPAPAVVTAETIEHITDIRIICLVLALMFLVLIIWRRKRPAE